MITLKTDLTWKAGQVNILPLIGETQISDDCTIQVESIEIANELVAIPDLDFYIVGTVKPTKGKTTPQVTTEVVKSEENQVEQGESIAPQTVTSEELPESEVIDSIAPQTTEGNTEEQIKRNLSTEKIEKDPVEELSGLTVAKLQELAAPFPKEEWQSLKKADLVNYLAVQLENAK